MGSNLDDVLVGDDRGNGLLGLAGDDILTGLWSGDLDVEASADLLWGAAGDDRLESGAGFDFASYDLFACVPVAVDLSSGIANGQG